MALNNADTATSDSHAVDGGGATNVNVCADMDVPTSTQHVTFTPAFYAYLRLCDRAGQTCGKPHTQHHCFSRLDVAWRAEFGDEAERPYWAELLRSGVAIFDLDYDAILAAMYALSVSAEGDCYLCVPPDPGIEAAALGASESVLPSTAPPEALHTFTLDSGASRCFFRDSTTLTPLSAPVPVRLADPVLARSSTVLPCPAVPSGSLSGLHLPSFSTNLICTCTQTGCHLATFTRRPGSSLYTLATKPPQVAAPAQVSALGPVAPPCSCCLLSHQTLLWHHRLSHPSLPRLRGMHSRLLGSGLPRSLPPLPPSPAPPCLPCVEGRQRAAPHSSSFPPTTAPLHTLHIDVWGPARVSGNGCERYFLLVVDDYTRYTTVFPLHSKGQVVDVLIPWIRAVCLQLRERFRTDLPVLHLHSDRGGEFSSNLLREFCRGEGILMSFTLPDSPQQDGIAERRIGLVMEVAHTSMIHAATPHFLWLFAVRYAAHQLNLWPRVSLPETSPTMCWTGKVGDASVFRVWGSRAFVHDTSADKFSASAIPYVFLGFSPVAPGWQFYHPTSRGVFPSQVVTFVESVPFTDPAPPGVSQVDPLPGTTPVEVGVGSGDAPRAASGGAEPGGAEPGGAEPEGVEPRGTASGVAESRGTASNGAFGVVQPELETLLLETLELGGVTAGAGGTGGAAAAGPGARPGGTGAAGTGGVGGAGAGDPMEPGAAGARGVGARGASAVDPGAVGTGAGGTGTGGAGAGGAGAVDPRAGGAGGTVRQRSYFVPMLQQPASPQLAPSPYTEQTGGLTERRKPASCPASPVRTGRRVPRPRPPPVPGTHAMTLRPSSVPLRVPLHAPPKSSLPTVPDPESDLAHAASPTVSRLLATVVTDPAFQSTASSALISKLVEFAAAYHLGYATALVAESESASPPSVGGECALGTDVECLAAAVPCFASMLIALEGDPYAPDIPTARSYAETFSPTLKMNSLRVLLHVAAQRDYELRSLDFSTAFLQGSLHEEIWLHRQPGFTRSFPAGTQWSLRRPVYGLRQAPRKWHDTLRTTLAALGFTPSTTDPSLFLRTDMSLLPFYVLVYVDELVFATVGSEALTLVKSELQKRHTCTNLGELRSYLGLQITRDKARCTITLTQSHMVHQVLQRFGFQFSSPQPTPLPTGHSLSAPPSDESVEPSGPFPELVGCLMYLMTCTRHDLAYPLSLLAHYVAPGRHRKVHWDAAKRVLRYLCSTSRMGLVLGGRGPVVLTGHVDASWVDDSAMQRWSQGYTLSLGSGSLSWPELRWLTYLLTDLGEQPRSLPVLYVDNKAMIALCQEHKLEHRTKHIALRYFLARELQQRGQLRLAYVATRANTKIYSPRHFCLVIISASLLC
ncbi:unnamed protein product [Closterium sp. NIES-54]